MVSSLKLRTIKSLIDQGYSFDPNNTNILLTNNERHQLRLYSMQRPEYKLHTLQRIVRLNRNIMPNKNLFIDEILRSMNLSRNGPKARQILSVIKNSNGVQKSLEIYYSRKRRDAYSGTFKHIFG